MFKPVKIGEKVLFKIRVKDVEKVRCCPELKNFAGKVVIAEKTPAGLFAFKRHFSSGFSGRSIESNHIVSPEFVDILQTG